MGSGFRVRGSGALSLLRSAWNGKGAKPPATADLRQAAGIGDPERATLLQILQLGCPRSTAAKYIGLTGEQLESLLGRDEVLTREVLRAEAEAEVRHMGNVHNASKDEKNWRTSVWWLEHRGLGVPESDAADAEYPEAVLAALEKFAELIVAEIPDVMRRQSLLTKLLHIAVESVEAPLVIDVDVQAAGGAKPPATADLRQAAGGSGGMGGLCGEEVGDDPAAQQ